MDKFKKFANIKAQVTKNLSKTTTTRVKRAAKNAGCISFDIYEQDDEIVRMIKTEVNKRTLTVQNLYDCHTSSSEAYNLYYGLQKRHTMTFASFRKWCEVLGVSYDITLTPL